MMNKGKYLCLTMIVVFCLIAGITITSAEAGNDLSGTWSLTVKSPRGTGNPMLTVKQGGNKITGTYQGKHGTLPVQGKVKSNNFEMSYNFDGKMMTYKGNIQGNQIAGTIEVDGKVAGAFKGQKKQK